MIGNAERTVDHLADAKRELPEATVDDLPRSVYQVQLCDITNSNPVSDVVQPQLPWVDVSSPEWWVLPLETQRVVSFKHNNYVIKFPSCVYYNYNRCVISGKKQWRLCMAECMTMTSVC